MIYIVTGANYGDEGKGLVTNAFASEDCLVVLSNGSSQRAHTVVHDGKRVVFRHFGSGTLKGAATYFSRDFLVNPAMFVREYLQLKEMGITPKVYMHEDCQFVTPLDMFANVNIEQRRDAVCSAHGTTGCGVWETIRRGKQVQYLRAGKSTITSDIIKYYEHRLSGIEDKLPDIAKDVLYGSALNYNFQQDVEFMLSHVQLIHFAEEKLFLHKFKDIIFENGQGLLLDTDYVGESIFTTPCHVGARIPARIIFENFAGENPKVESIYVTRTYLTRHGAGDIGAAQEAGTTNWSEISPFMTEDKTNVPNPCQGTIRYAAFSNQDGHDLVRRINRDSILLKTCGIDTQTSLAVTHTNEYALENLTKQMMFGSPVAYRYRLYTSDNEETLNMAGDD